MSDPEYAAAGEAVEALVGDGSEWVSTYGIPAAIIAVGVGLAVSLLVRYGKRVRGWLS